MRIDVPDAIKFEIAETIADTLGQQYEVVAIDGVRVIFEDGWGLIRASNTQPALVIRAEAQNPARRDEITAFLLDQISETRAALT
jgi:phosphomannomutase/phosphoglucomutase